MGSTELHISKYIQKKCHALLRLLQLIVIHFLQLNSFICSWFIFPMFLFAKISTFFFLLPFLLLRRWHIIVSFFSHLTTYPGNHSIRLYRGLSQYFLQLHSTPACGWTLVHSTILWAFRLFAITVLQWITLCICTFTLLEVYFQSIFQRWECWSKDKSTCSLLDHAKLPSIWGIPICILIVRVWECPFPQSLDNRMCGQWRFQMVALWEVGHDITWQFWFVFMLWVMSNNLPHV